MPAFSRLFRGFSVVMVCGGALSVAATAHAQNARFTLRAEPDVIAANGISTTSIFVQVPTTRSAITPTQTVRFATTAGTIEGQSTLTDGVARVLLRSANTPGTAVVTAFIGSSREVITVEFSAESQTNDRYLEVAAPYVAYGKDVGVITSSGKSAFDFGDIHIESDVRLDVDLYTERIWAQGNKDGVTIRQGRGAKAKTLRGDRLFFDLQRNIGVIRRAEGDSSGTVTGARQEFFGSDFAALPPREADDDKGAQPALVTPAPAPAAVTPAAGQILGDGINNDAPRNVLENRASDAEAFSESGAVSAKIAEDAPATDAATPDAQTAPVSNEPTNETAPDAENVPTTFDLPTGVIRGDRPGAKLDLDAPGATSTQSNPRVAEPRATDANPDALPSLPAYKPLPDSGPDPRVVELPPPSFNVSSGYWVAARRLRVLPRDEIQFQRASVYYNGGKAFKVPLYVLPLDGSFNPTTDLFGFNSAGGLSVRFPFYYQADKRGTGALFVRNDPGDGFSPNRKGLSLELDQRYAFSQRSRGRFGIDQIGNGPVNLNLSHQLELNPTTNATFFLNVPRQSNLFARAGLTKDLKTAQLGLETFYDAPDGQRSTARGQFYARLRPKTLGKSGFTYSVSANLMAISRVANRRLVPGSSGGGIGVPGSTAASFVTDYNSLFGQTLSTSLQAPLYAPWRGGQFTGSLLATAYNYSDGRRGFAPGITLGYAQRLGKIANFRLDYTYDRSSLGLYGATGTNFTNYVSASLDAQLGNRLSLSTFLSQSLSDQSLYGSTDLSYRIGAKWRAGVFADYSSFLTDDTFNYGWSLARAVGPRELSINYDAVRDKIYFQIGNQRY